MEQYPQEKFCAERCLWTQQRSSEHGRLNPSLTKRESGWMGWGMGEGDGNLDRECHIQ